MGYATMAVMDLPTVSFATCCWKKDWRQILLTPDYLRLRQIGHHKFPFAEKILIINNVDESIEEVKRAAQQLVDQGILTRFVKADEAILPTFGLDRSQLVAGPDHPEVSPDWVYHNAMGPLTAIYACRSEYLLYLTGDVRLDAPVDWIRASLQWMGRDRRIKVANLTWNENYGQAKKEAFQTTWNFYRSNTGFSDQLFLIRRADFLGSIYSRIHPDTTEFPRGYVFERRVESHKRYEGWERITYRRGSYIHENWS